ncbi:MAG: 4,5-DOPA dioxygenase extradiol [Planctomycetes bacterium]|nr:4,5-DOPA dioxygenase extradiol [Planctomycetota bacterium]
MPTLYVGHGSPMNAIQDNAFTQAFARLGRELPAPKAILCVSAHWYVDGTFVTGNAQPDTIYDFWGFPDELSQVKYPAPGNPALAQQIAEQIGSGCSVNSDWGYDHGTWSVLCHMYPRCDVPVLQLSIDWRVSMERHLEIGRALSALRDQGVLLVGSGALTHNGDFERRHAKDGWPLTPGWAARVVANATRACRQRDTAYLCRLLDTADGRMAHPTPDHYLPLLYVVGAARDDDEFSVAIDAVRHGGSLGMHAVQFG